MPQPRVALRVYRLLLRLYPAQFREDYEREILLVFCRERSSVCAARRESTRPRPSPTSSSIAFPTRGRSASKAAPSESRFR
jgi:hypothetical protein